MSASPVRDSPIVVEVEPRSFTHPPITEAGGASGSSHHHSRVESHAHSGSVTPRAHRPSEAAVHSLGTRMIATLLPTDRPENYSGLPWDVRPLLDPDATGSSVLGCTMPRGMVHRLDFSLRLALIAILPTAILTYNAATASAFVSPSLTVLCAAVTPKLRIGTTIATALSIITALAVFEGFGHVIMAIEPAQHWALWFSVYLVVTFFVAFLTDGGVSKLALYFFNQVMVKNWTGVYPLSKTPYEFVGWITVSVVVGVGFGTLVPFLPYPRTCRDDAEERLQALYQNLSTAFSGVVQTVWIFGRHPGVQRRIAVNRLMGIRRDMHRQYIEAVAASKGMMTEIHSTTLHDRLAARLLVASDLCAALDGMLDMLYQVARQPEPIDDNAMAQKWGSYMLPAFVLASDYVEEFCHKAGDINYRFSTHDLNKINRFRERIRVEVQEVRRITILSDEGHAYIMSFPFMSIGYLVYNFGRFLRVLGSFPIEDDSCKELLDLPIEVIYMYGPQPLNDAPNKPADTPAMVSQTPSLGAQFPREPFAVENGVSPPTTYDGNHSTHTAPPVNDGSVSVHPSTPAGRSFRSLDDGGREVSPNNVNTSFRFVLPPPVVVAVEPTEPLVVRFLLAWPRGLVGAGKLIVGAFQGDRGILVKMREAAKLTFAMTTALGLCAVLDVAYPTNGAAVIGFVKDPNAGMTILASSEYIASTILGSVYGFLGASLATNQALVILALCVIGFFAGLPRLSPRYAHFAELVAFFAVLGVAPGYANSSLLLQTVQANVALSTWLVITHTVLWPVWPSDVLTADLQNALEQLRVMLITLLTALDTEDPTLAGDTADKVRHSRNALRNTADALRRHIALCVEEPTLRPSPFPEREFHRVVDSIERAISLIYPTASAVTFLRRDLPQLGQDHTPTRVLAILRREATASVLQVDQLMRGIFSVVESSNPAECIGSLLESQADMKSALRRAFDAGIGEYLNNLVASLDARAYEMPAVHTVLHFFDVLPDHLNALLEAVIDARRTQVFIPRTAP